MTLSTDAARVAELDRLDALDAGDDRDLQALVALAAQVCGVPMVAINLITADAQHQVAAYGFDPGICARADSMCAAVLPEPEPVVVPDARADARFAANPFVTGEIGDVRFYASSPLVTRNGVHIGRLCAFDDVPHDGLGSPETLAVLADRVVDLLELRVQGRELARSVAELSQARADLTRSNARLAGFAEQVSHDLRSPLTGLIASLELLEDEPAMPSDPAVSQLLGGARRSADRMRLLIDRLLEQAVSAPPRAAEQTDLRAAVDLVRDDLAVVLADDALVDVPTDALVDVDPALLHVVLLNLVGNAVKFSRPVAAPRVVVTASRVDGAWRISVSDNGPGIPADQRPLAWEPYVRLEGSVEGTGIGLAAVRAMVEDAGGSVGLDEAPGGGLVVWVELPA